MIRIVYTITQNGRPVGRLEKKVEDTEEFDIKELKDSLDIELEYMEKVWEGSVWEKD